MTPRNPRVWIAAGGLAVVLLSAAPEGTTQSRRPTRAPVATAATPALAPVSLNLRDVPLRTALQTLFQSSGLQHAVESSVPNTPITMKLRAVPFRTALRTMLRLAPGVTYRKEGDVYLIGLRRPAPALTAAPVPAPLEATATDVATAEKIPLNFLHPAVAAAVLGGVLIPNEQLPPVYGGFGGSGGYGGYGSFGGGYSGGLSGGLGQQGFGGYPGGFNGLNSSVGGFRGALNQGSTRSASQGLVGPRSRRRF